MSDAVVWYKITFLFFMIFKEFIHTKDRKTLKENAAGFEQTPWKPSKCPNHQAMCSKSQHRNSYL